MVIHTALIVLHTFSVVHRWNNIVDQYGWSFTLSESAGMQIGASETGAILFRINHPFVFNPVGESVCLSVGVCEWGTVRPPPRERVSRAAAEGRRAVCM